MSVSVSVQVAKSRQKKEMTITTRRRFVQFAVTSWITERMIHSTLPRSQKERTFYAYLSRIESWLLVWKTILAK